MTTGYITKGTKINQRREERERREQARLVAEAHLAAEEETKLRQQEKDMQVRVPTGASLKPAPDTGFLTNLFDTVMNSPIGYGLNVLDDVNKTFVGGVSAPAAVAIQDIFGEAPGKDALDKARSWGSSWEQLTKTFRGQEAPTVYETALAETRLPPGVMGALQVIDPILLAGPLGKLPMVAKAAKGMKGLPFRAHAKSRAADRGITGITDNLHIPTENTLMRETATSFPNKTETAAEQVGNSQNFLIKRLAWFKNHIDPSTMLKGTVLGRSLLAHNRLLDVGDSQWVGLSTRFNKLAKSVEVGADGRVLNARSATGELLSEDARPLMQDFMERRGDYLYTDDQTKLLDSWGELSNFLLESQEAAGVEMSELLFKREDTFQYFTRLVTHIKGKAVKPGIAKPVGAKRAPTSTRSHEFAEDGLAKGIDYTTDIVSSIEVAWKAAVRSIGDARLVQTVKELPDVRMTKLPAHLAVQFAREKATSRVINNLERQLTTALKALDEGKSFGQVSSKVYANTLTAFEKQYPATGLRTALQQGNKAQIKKAQDLVLKQQIVATSSLDEVTAKAKRVLKDQKKVKRIPNERKIAMPGFDGLAVPEDVYKKVTAHFATETNRLVKGMSTVSGISRTLGTTFDFGWPFIQGLPLLLNNPVLWGKTAINSAKAFANKESWDTFLADPTHFGALRRAADNGVVFEQTAEMVEYSGRGAIVTKLPIVGGTAERAQRAFTTGGNVARVLWWEALEDTAMRQGGKGLNELADFVNKATGVMSTRNLGISELQRVREAAVLFAPRYTRAAIGLMTDTLRGGLKGQLAREALVKMATSGSIAYIGMATAMGQKPYLDPRPASLGGDGGKFFTLQIGDARVGIGGSILSISRLLAHSYAAAVDDPKQFISISSEDQPFLRFFRGKLSPAASMSWDTISGRNFLGEPIEPFANFPDFDNMKKFAEEEGLKRMTPFWMESVVGDNPRAGGAGLVGEFFGMRSFPVSLWERRNDMRTEYTEQYLAAHPSLREMGFESWDDLPRTEQLRIENEHPDLEDATELAQSQNIDRSDALQKSMTAHRKEYATGRTRFIEALEDAQSEYQLTDIKSSVFKTKFDEAALIYRNDVDRIQRDPKYQTVREHFATLNETQKRPFADEAFDQYIAQVVANPDLEDAFGNYNFDLRNQLEAAFTAQWGQDIVNYSKMRIDQSRVDEPPMARELRTLRSNPSFRTYWESDRLILEQLGRPELLANYRRYRSADSVTKKIMGEAQPIYKQIDSTVTKLRQRMREKNTELDMLLFRFGYTTTVRNENNVGREAIILGAL